MSGSFTLLLYRFSVLILLILSVSGCTPKSRQFAAPDKKHYTKAVISGHTNIRYWGDQRAPYADTTIHRLKKNRLLHKRVDILALSGGAEDGAYGAGFLKGWSERGERPEFTMVTGISTGALIAPFAFLGAEYDDVLQRLFTESSRKNIFVLTPFTALFGGSAVTDTAPLRRILKEEIDDAFVAALAREGRKGRILQIGTTNLDAQRPVIWEITEIAKSGHPDAKRLIQQIMLASASIPGVFPPVLIDVMIDGKKHQELHVDGGVTQQIFVYPYDFDVRWYERTLGIRPKKNFWLIRNTKITPEYHAVDLWLSDIAGRSVSTLIKYQGRDNLKSIIAVAKRDGFKVHITHVPASFDTPLEDMFDKKYMKALYKVGYEKGRSESAWYTDF
ncbi:MAG: patatin-like phospholipase family protein [Dysgonamonadaceae bacterium]|nr:patatin-like phospholipase family protein [Dysgonamonadaceae bacterium]